MMAAGPRRLAIRLLPPARRFRTLVAPLARFIEGGARFGYAARGAVYVSVGVMALLAALRLSPHATGAIGAMRAWGAWPPGIALLWAAGLGLYAFAGWRALQALFDADRLGAKPAALAERVGKAVSGLVYGTLAVSVFGVLDAIEDLHEVDDQAATQAAIGDVLAMPGGEALVMALGALVLAAGVGNAVRAFIGHFTETLDCDPGQARLAGSLARVGYFARGLAMLLAGGLTLMAGWHARASEAYGVGGALEVLKAQRFGHPLLGVIALGLIAFGLFSFFKACLRRIGC